MVSIRSRSRWNELTIGTMHTVIRRILVTNHQRSHVSLAWCRNSVVFVAMIDVMLNHVYSIRSRIISRDPRRPNLRSNTSIPAMVGMAMAIAQGIASNAVQV